MWIDREIVIRPDSCRSSLLFITTPYIVVLASYAGDILDRSDRSRPQPSALMKRTESCVVSFKPPHLATAESSCLAFCASEKRRSSDDAGGKGLGQSEALGIAGWLALFGLPPGQRNPKEFEGIRGECVSGRRWLW